MGAWCADSPHHITSIFYPVRSKDPLGTGSIGVGLAVEPRLTACSISTGGESRIASRVVRLIGLSSPQGVDVKAPLPHSAGYAVSAAVAVASSLVVGRIAGRGYWESLRTAHLADLFEGTGLGDVLAISCGVGVVLRRRAGAPGVGETECLQLPGTLSILSLETGFMNTRDMLASLGERVYELARSALKRIIDNFTVEEFLYESTRFSRESGMLKAALGGRELPSLRGLAGVYGKKRVVILLLEREWLADAVEDLREEGFEPRVLEPSMGPPRLWWT